MADEAPATAEESSLEDRARQSIWNILERGAAQDSPELPEALRYLDEKHLAQEIALKGEYARQELELRRAYARNFLRILAAQLLIADTVFVVFAWAGRHWDLSTAVIDTWLGAVVVQVVGVVLVITRHLFPSGMPDRGI